MKKLHVLLHQTKTPDNIGAVARAMGNMGIDRLVLVDPLCEVDDRAMALAVGCTEILKNHTRYNSWDEFYQNEGEGLRIGFTARSGKERPERLASELFAELAQETKPEFENIYLAFGREDFGLSADDLLFFHHTCTLETFGHYSSLNLSQAVLLALYVVQNQLRMNSSEKKERTKAPEAMSYPQETIRLWLETLGFDISSPRTNVYRVLTQFFLRHRPTEKEMRALDVVLQQSIRKLRPED